MRRAASCRRASRRCAGSFTRRCAGQAGVRVVGRRGGAGRGRVRRRRVSDGRVAHAGNGNSATSGTGISGCITNIVPGFAIVARFWCVAGRNPYSGRVGLGRVEAADDADRRVGDDAALHLARGLLRADQHDAERTAALGDVEQDLLDRRLAVARRVLVRARRARRTAAASRVPVCSLRSNARAQRDADDEALGAVGEVVQVDDGDLRVVGLDAVPRRARGRRPARSVRATAATTSRRRTNALIVPSPVAAPAHTGRSSRRRSPSRR